MAVDNKAGILASHFPLADIAKIVSLYYENHYENGDPRFYVSFGTSGHRGSSLNSTYTCDHVKAIAKAIADLRASFNATGPLFLGKDTHALSTPAFYTVLGTLLANNVEVVIDTSSYTPTPVISQEIVRFNLGKTTSLADGIIITPSHNPPQDGGFKYNPIHGGPADPRITKAIEKRANEILDHELDKVKTLSVEKALLHPNLHVKDFRTDFLNDLEQVIDLKAIAESSLKILVNAQGGTSSLYWHDLKERFKLNLTVMNDIVDPTFQFIPYDYDGNIRMDCMSPYTMGPLVKKVLKEGFDFGIANDPDADRHGVVTSKGLLNSNCYLSSIIDFLLNTRSFAQGKVGKTIGASMLMDRIIKSYKREVFETPIGFKWFATPLFNKEIVFGCEESAGASFLSFKGEPFTTDKDGFLASLIGLEIMAKTHLSLDDYYEKLTLKHGKVFYGRDDVLITRDQKEAFKNLNAQTVKIESLAGSKVIEVFDHAAGNHAPIGGIKVLSEEGWFSARPSGTENLYKIYYESFKSLEHMQEIKTQAQEIVGKLTGL